MTNRTPTALDRNSVLLFDPAGGPIVCSLDLTDWLGGDTIDTVAWAIEPQTGGKPSVAAGDTALDGKSATVTIAATGWTLGQVYRLHADYRTVGSGEGDRVTFPIRAGAR